MRGSLPKALENKYLPDVIQLSKSYIQREVQNSVYSIFLVHLGSRLDKIVTASGTMPPLIPSIAVEEPI